MGSFKNTLSRTFTPWISQAFIPNTTKFCSFSASGWMLSFFPSLCTVYRFSLCGKNASFGDFTVFRVSRDTFASGVHALKFTWSLTSTGRYKSWFSAILWNNADRFSFAILYIHYPLSVTMLGSASSNVKFVSGPLESVSSPA